MSIILAGGELDVFNPYLASCIESTAVAAAYDATKSRCAIQLGATPANGAGSGFFSPTFPAMNDLWLHWTDYFQTIGGTTNVQLFACSNASSQIVFRILKTTNGGVCQAQYWDGSAFINTGATFTLNALQLYYLDLNINVTAGTWAIYSNKVLLGSGAGITSAAANIVSFEFNNNNSSGNNRYVSQIILATVDSRNMQLQTIAANGNGANTAWTGTFTDINEIPLNDATFIETPNIGDLETFTIASPSFGASNILAICVGTRASRAAVGPQNIEAITRVAGTNYFGAQFSPGLVLGGKCTVFPLNPATGLVWQNTDITAANFQFGAASRA